MRGKHEVLDDGGITISSPQQGRVFEVDAKGEVVFEFVNRYDADNALLVSELIALPLDYFGDSLNEQCSSEAAASKPGQSTRDMEGK